MENWEGPQSKHFSFLNPHWAVWILNLAYVLRRHGKQNGVNEICIFLTQILIINNITSLKKNKPSLSPILETRHLLRGWVRTHFLTRNSIILQCFCSDVFTDAFFFFLNHKGHDNIARFVRPSGFSIRITTSRGFLHVWLGWRPSPVHVSIYFIRCVHKLEIR